MEAVFLETVEEKRAKKLSREEWIKKIEENEEKIENVGLEMYRKATENHLRKYTMYLYQDGTVVTIEDVCSGSKDLEDHLYGQCIKIMHMCFEGKKEVEEDDLEEDVEMYGLEYVQDKLAEKYEQQEI